MAMPRAERKARQAAHARRRRAARLQHGRCTHCGGPKDRDGRLCTRCALDRRRWHASGTAQEALGPMIRPPAVPAPPSVAGRVLAGLVTAELLGGRVWR